MTINGKRFLNNQKLYVLLASCLIVTLIWLVWSNSDRRLRSKFNQSGGEDGHDLVEKLDRDHWPFFDIPARAKSLEIFLTPSGVISISYLLDEEFPATKTVDEISIELKNRGWHLMNGSVEQVDTWDQDAISWTNQRVVPERYGNAEFEQNWQARWENKNGDVLNGYLSYPQVTRGMANSHLLSVHFAWHSSEFQKEIELIEKLLNDKRSRGAFEQ